jgi:hypothetical protein
MDKKDMTMSLPNLRTNTKGPPMESVRRLTTIALTPCPSPTGRGETESCDHFLALLSEFYETLPEPPAIDVTFVPGESIPQPQRDLLVHLSDMTSTLTRHYGEAIRLRVLDRHQGPQWYRRLVVLETETSRRPVEYGAMRILLPLLSEAARLEVLAARSPLGAILARHGLAYRHCPGGFFKIRSNRLIEQSLGLPAPQALYGRCNCMSDSVGRVVAEVVEVLPN